MDSIIWRKIDFIFNNAHLFSLCSPFDNFHCCRWLLGSFFSCALSLFFGKEFSLFSVYSFAWTTQNKHPAEVCGIWRAVYRNLYEHIFLNLMWIEDKREFYYMQNQRACVVWCIFVCADRVAGKKEPTTIPSTQQTKLSTNLMAAVLRIHWTHTLMHELLLKSHNEQKIKC